MDKKKIVNICVAAAALGALLAFIGVLIPFMDDFSALKFFGDIKDGGASAPEASGLFQAATYITLILGIAVFAFAALKLIAIYIVPLRILNLKLFNFIFCAACVLLLVFGILFLVGTGAPYAAKEWNDLMEAGTVEKGAAGILTLIGSIIAGLGGLCAFPLASAAKKES